MEHTQENLKILHPPGWAKPKGYAYGVVARGRMVFIAGMIGWSPQGVFEADDFVGQTRQALQNILETLAEAGGKPEHLVRLTWFITSKQEYLASLDALGAAYREVMGRHYPTMSVVEVKSLIEDRAKVEIEATAVIPD